MTSVNQSIRDKALLPDLKDLGAKLTANATTTAGNSIILPNRLLNSYGVGTEVEKKLKAVDLENFHIDLNSEEYQKLSNKEKGFYIINEFGKFLYNNDKEWEMLSDKERGAFFDTKVKEIFGNTNLNKSDQLLLQQELLSNFEMALSNANGETNLKKIMDNFNSADAKQKAEMEYVHYTKLKEKGVELNDYQKFKLAKYDYDKNLSSYAKEHGLDISKETELKYLQQIKAEKGDLSVLEQTKYEVLKNIKDRFGSFVEADKYQGKSLEELLLNNTDYNKNLVCNNADNTSAINWKLDTNRDTLLKYINDNLKNCKTQEERNQWFKETFNDLDEQGIAVLTIALGDKHSKINKQQRNDYMGLLAKSSASNAQVMAATVLASDPADDKSFVTVSNGLNEHIQASAQKNDIKNADALVATSKVVTLEIKDKDLQAAQTVSLAETNYSTAIIATAEIAKAEGITDIVDNKLVSSEIATNDTKALYAKSAIEIEKNDEAKLARNEKLNSYGNAYFTKGTVEALPSYETDEAVIKANNVINDTVENKLDKEGRKLVTQARMDVMPEFNSNLQKTMYEQITQSKHDDVLETGAKNVYQLDDSIKDWAVEQTKSLGKDNVTNSIRTEITQSNNTNAVNTSTYATESQITNKYNTVPTSITLTPAAKEVVNEIKFFSGQKIPHDKAIEMFKNLSRKEQVEILHSLPANQFDKLPILVCEFFPDLIPAFVNKGKGIQIINSCSAKTVSIAIRCMQTGSNETKKQLRDMIASRPEFFAKGTQEWANETLYNGKKQDDNERKPFNALS